MDALTSQVCRSDTMLLLRTAVGCYCAQMEGSVGAVINSVRVNTVGQPGQYVKMGVLALLYTLQVKPCCSAAANLCLLRCAIV